MKSDIPNGFIFFLTSILVKNHDEIGTYEIWVDGKKGLLKNDLWILRGQIMKKEEINPHKACLSFSEKSVQLLHLQIVL